MLSADEIIVLDKIETPTYGVDASPTGSANAVLTSGFSMTPLDGGSVSRELDRPYSGASPAILINKHVSMNFNIELAASGTSGAGITAPKWSPTLQSCGFDENVITTVGQERVEFTPSALGAASALTSVTRYINYSNQQHKVLGVRGGWGIRIGQSGIPMFTVQSKGLYVAPTQTAAPTPDFTGWRDPLTVDNDNTPTITLHGYACTLFSLEINSGITPQLINVPGAEEVLLTKRAVTGKIVIANPGITAKDFFAIANAHTTGALAFVHGTVAGDITQLDAPAVQLLNPGYGNIQDVQTLELDLLFIPTAAGNDEIVVTTK